MIARRAAVVQHGVQQLVVELSRPRLHGQQALQESQRGEVRQRRQFAHDTEFLLQCDVAHADEEEVNLIQSRAGQHNRSGPAEDEGCDVDR